MPARSPCVLVVVVLALVACAKPADAPVTRAPSTVAPDTNAPSTNAPSTKPVDAGATAWPPLPTGWREDCWLAPIPELHFENPCTLALDIDGDRAPDRARLVVNAKGQRGIVIVRASGASLVAGAGTMLGNGGDEFSWMDAWRVATERPRWAKGDGLVVERTEAASGVIAWDGTKLRWSQRGD